MNFRIRTRVPKIITMFMVCGTLAIQSVGTVYAQDLEGAVEADVSTPMTQAEKDEQARQAYLRGRELFDAKSFDESAEEFRNAYELSGRPILLLSIASAHERAGRFDLALRTLRDYRPFATDEDAGEVDFRIQSIEGRIQALEQAKSPPAEDKALVLKKTAPPAEKKTSLATVGWVLTGVGVASAITGGVFYALGEQKHQDVANATTRSEAVALVNSGDSKKNTGYIFMGAGAAAIIGGVTLVLVSSDDETQVALSVSPSSEGAVLALTGGF